MYLGIDTHKRYSQVAVVDGDGNLQEESRLPNDRLEELAEQYTGAEAAIEASGHYRPIYEMLESISTLPSSTHQRTGSSLMWQSKPTASMPNDSH